MKRVQFGMRHLLLVAVLAGILASAFTLNVRTVRLNDRARDVEKFAKKTVSEDWKFKVLRGLSVDNENQKNAIRTLLTHWDRLEFRNVGLWPEIDDRRLNTMIFADAFPRGTSIVVIVLMDADKETAVDAISYVASSESDQVLVGEKFDSRDDYQLTLWDHPAGNEIPTTVRKAWTIGPSGYIEMQAIANSPPAAGR